MRLIQTLFIRVREKFARNPDAAQTMTEYVLVLAAIAVAVYGTYVLLGNSVSSFASGADSVLTSA